MTDVPLWQHIIVVLGLLTSNAVTFLICKRRVESLQLALVAKKVLLGVDDGNWAHIEPGSTMVLNVSICPKRVRITSRDRAKLKVVFE